MTIKDIIKKGIKGGYLDGVNDILVDDFIEIALDKNGYFLNYLLLQPKFWKAVGKVEGWECHQCEKCKRTLAEYHNGCVCCGNKMLLKVGIHKMHQMINALAEGKSVSDFLETL